MDHLRDPAVLGGVITGLMLWAWALGRWQGTFPATDAQARGEEPRLFVRDVSVDAATDEALPCQQVAREERLAALGDGTSLGQIHAEVSAYRQATRVLSHLEAEDMPLGWLPASAQRVACRYLGISGKPTCSDGASISDQRACNTCEIGNPADLLIRIDQPSAEPSAFTRV